MTQIKINIEEGFIVHWCQEFLDHYGHNSEFPKAVSDMYTIKIARLMEEKGGLGADSEVALFSSQLAVEEVRGLIEACKEAGSILYKEAFGTSPIGTTEKAIDDKIGAGTFKSWLNNFENGKYSACRDILKIPH